MNRDDRAEVQNLLLVCRNCHKPLDAGGQIGRWTVDELHKRKREHEERIRVLTEIGADRAAYLIRLIGPIRGSSPELARETVLMAATASGVYPQLLPGAFYSDVDLDLRNEPEPNCLEAFARQAERVRGLAERVHDGVRRDALHRAAVFAFGRIPLLVQLGASLDDKLDTRIFQRHRVDAENAWVWPSDLTSASFLTRCVRQGPASSSVALVLSISGSIDASDLPEEIDETFSVYEIRPVERQGPSVIASPGDLAMFEKRFRDFLALVEREHGKIDTIAVFPAIPVAAAVTLGRALMPSVSPALTMFERDDSRRFYRALEVRR